MQAKEPLLPLAEAIQQATGRRVHLSTGLRWCIRGVRGQRLESWMVGGRRLTSVDAVQRFVDQTTAAANGLPDAPPTSAQQRRIQDEAMQRLENHRLK